MPPIPCHPLHKSHAIRFPAIPVTRRTRISWRPWRPRSPSWSAPTRRRPSWSCAPTRRRPYIYIYISGEVTIIISPTINFKKPLIFKQNIGFHPSGNRSSFQQIKGFVRIPILEGRRGAPRRRGHRGGRRLPRAHRRGEGRYNNII